MVGRAAALALTAVLLGAPPALARGWSRPQRLVGATAADLLPPQLALTGAGSGELATGWFAEGEPALGQAWLVGPLPGRAPARRLVPGQREVLGFGAFGGTVDVLAAGSPHGRPCCSTVQVLSLGARGFTTPHPLVRGLAGVVLGQLLPAGRGVLAAVASASGAWAAQARPGARFGPVHRLSARGAAVGALAAAPLRGGRTLVAFATTPGPASGSSGPADQSIMVAAGTAARPPGPGRPLVTLAPGHVADELALAPAPAAPTLAWVERFVDPSGAYRTEVVAADPTRSPRARAFAQPGVASGLTAAADREGDEVLAWTTCDAQPQCQVVALSRRAGGRLATPVALGAVDPGTAPAAAVSAQGTAFVGWVQRGRVLIAPGRPGSRRFGPAARLPGEGFAAALTLAAGGDGAVVAAWVDGSPRLSVLSARHTP